MCSSELDVLKAGMTQIDPGILPSRPWRSLGRCPPTLVLGPRSRAQSCALCRDGMDKEEMDHFGLLGGRSFVALVVALKMTIGRQCLKMTNGA